MTRIELSSAEILKSFHNKNIVFIADIHHDLVNRINDLRPDKILMGGDYVHRDSKNINSCYFLPIPLKNV